MLDQKSADLAHEIAGLLYPSYSDSNLSQVIKYEKDIVLLRKTIQAKQKADEVARVQAKNQAEWRHRVLRQGPWDEVNDLLPLTGSPALPMPVSISDEKSLAAFFNHLSVGGTHDTLNVSALALSAFFLSMAFRASRRSGWSNPTLRVAPVPQVSMSIKIC